jgi:S-DNA-T family DNA segregation ATPase FtsK/SpoIIIE
MAHTRRRTRRKFSPGNGGAARAPEGLSVSLVDEALGIVMGGVGLFLLLSLGSADPSTPVLTDMVSPEANWGGLVGHWLASTLTYALGAGAFVLVGLLWQAAFLWITHASRQPRVLTGVGGFLIIVGLGPVLDLSLHPALVFIGNAGGLVGHGLKALIVPYCNVGGTFLASAIIVAVGGILVLRPMLPLGFSALASARQLWSTRVKPALRGWVSRPRMQPRRARQSSAMSPPVVSEPAPEAASDAALPAASYDNPEAALSAPPTPTPPRRSATASSTSTTYNKPPLSLLHLPSNGKRHGNGIDLSKQAKILEGKLHDFGIDGRVVQVLPGPVVTMYEFEPASGIKVSRIVNLADDLALGMKALSVRIVAPVPGKSVVGIEIPNPHREPVLLYEILVSPAFQQAPSKLVLALGKDILGGATVTDLAQIPHLLIAGATGSGKSVGLNSMICSILINAAPDEVKFIMIDPKMLELSVYDGIPHLIAPVVTHPKKAAAALHWAVEEMERRYRLLAEHGVRGIDGYNQTHPEQCLPYIVVVIDELADLMLVARRDVEDSLTRLAQMARAAGIHLLVATQRPSVDVLTGIIKANFPARISFQVSSRTDSRTILDSIGAERLLGKGDMLFLPPGTSKLLRIHGAYVSESEIKQLVDYLRTQQVPVYDFSIFAVKSDEQVESEDFDPKYDEAVALVARLGQASASLIQRHLRLGYNRAARLIEVLEREGVVGPADGSRAREVYVKEIPEPPFR